MTRWAACLALVVLVTGVAVAEQVTVLADFEDGLGGWTTEGTAFGISTLPDEHGRIAQGKAFADSRRGVESNTGVLRSPAFKCPDEVRFTANGWDYRDGTAGRSWFRLKLLDGTIIAQSRPPLCTGQFVEMRWQVWSHKGEDVYMEVVDGAADGSFAWLALDYVRLVDLGPLVRPGDSDLFAVGAGAPADGKVIEGAGVSFSPWAGPPSYENGEYAIPVGCQADELYLLGMTSTLDQGCASWPEHNDFTRDFTRQQMIGDKAGDLRIEYADGTQETVPLVFGVTMWWDLPWNAYREPLASDPEGKAALEASRHLWEVLTPDGKLRFVLALDCGGRRVERVVLVDSKAKAGCPAVWAASVRTREPAPGMVALGHHAYDAQWLQANRMDAERAAPEAWAGALKRLKQAVGMTDADLPERVAWDAPRGFTGPGFRLQGGVLGDILTNAYYHTVDSAANRSIRADGFIYCAPPDMPDYNAYNSIGTYQIDSRGAGSSWTRGYEYLRDLSAWGYLDKVTRAIDWADSMLDFYPTRCGLRVNWQGKEQPWGAHWATCADQPPPTLEPGWNEIPGDENDGHAMTMTMRYAQWRALGRDLKWLRERWGPATEAADWLCFVLDYTGQDVLYGESEGTCYGMGFDRNAARPYDVYPHYDVFTNAVGLLALRQSVEMARALGEEAQAARWESYVRRLQRGMPVRCVEQDPVWGKVWRVHPNSIWPAFDERLAPVFELPYLEGFDPARMSDEWRSISLNSLRLQIGNPPDYHHGLGLGYGQGWIAAAALLMDEMGTAKPLLDNLARYMYFPRHPFPYTGIEGIVVNEDGDFRVRNGSIGIDEGLYVTRVWRVMMGVDDTQPGALSLMPRLPAGYPALWVSRHAYSVARSDGGAEVRGKLTYRMQRSDRAIDFRADLDHPVPALKVRLGPLGQEPKGWKLTVNGEAQACEVVRSGDSWWVWADLGTDSTGGRCRLAAP